MHHLNSTAGEAKGHWPKRSRSSPINKLVHIGDYEAFVDERFGHMFQDQILIATGGNRSAVFW